MIAKWEFGSNDLGTYIKCSKCGKKISSLDVIMADTSINTCPKCNSQMTIDDEILEKVYISAPSDN